VFVAWLPGEPTDTPSGIYAKASEQELAMYPTGWNDEPDSNRHSFYMVEYEGCNPPTSESQCRC